MLLAGVPVLAGSMLLAARGAPAAVITWLGSVGFLLYNSLMFVFAPPANQFFLLYLVMPALGAWSAGAVLWQADVAAFGAVLQADAREGDRRLPVGGSSPERGHLDRQEEGLTRPPRHRILRPAGPLAAPVSEDRAAARPGRARSGPARRPPRARPGHSGPRTARAVS